MNPAVLTVSSLSLELGGKSLCENLDFAIANGESWALLGRNGAGKTTLLHCLMGLHTADKGSIMVSDQNLESISRRELATKLGILFQEGMDSLPATVLDTVMLGRHPHQRSLFYDTEQDRQIALDALRVFNLENFARRQLDSLSGGEQQRLALAMLYTQRPDLYLLDEPSNHLDLAFQVRLISRFSSLVSKENASILMATHDINLAARFCDHVVLLLPDGQHRVGPTDEVLTEDNLSLAFGCRVRKLKEGQLALFYPVQSDQI